MSLAAALLAGAAVWLAVPPVRDRAPRRRADMPIARLVMLAGACLGLGIAVAVGGGAGIALGVLAAAAVLSAGPRIEQAQAAAARERAAEAVRSAVPDTAGLLAALLASGATVSASLRSCAWAVRGPARAPLERVVAALDLGADDREAWATAPPGLEAIGWALERSALTGSPAAALLDAVAADAARDVRARADAAARRAGVRAVLPLVACFLPAFLLVGVVPVVVSVAGSILA